MGMLLPSMSLDEIRRRVREAEALLRVAAQHARDAHDDPANNEHANARIQSICREVEGLFPGMNEPSVPDQEVEEALAGLKAAASAAQAEREAAGEAQETAEDEEAGDADEEDEEDEADEEDEDAGEVEWEVDYAKLGAAIENEELMSKFPEPARTAFKRAARYLVESHERQELFARVLTAFETLSQLTAQNVEDTRRKLAMAMTLEELASKNKA
jgi:hypothetical protein